jgi:hypothetical protein
MAAVINNNGAFAKGYDHRRYSTNNALMSYHQELSTLLREQSLLAVDYIINVMHDDKAPVNVRLAAAKDILDRGIGRSVDRVSMATYVEDNDGVDVSELSNAQLMNIIKQLN